MISLGLFVGMQVLSLCVLFLFVHEYKRISHKHSLMLAAIETKMKPRSTLSSAVIIWMYVISTFAIAIATGSLYWFVFYG